MVNKTYQKTLAHHLATSLLSLLDNTVKQITIYKTVYKQRTDPHTPTATTRYTVTYCCLNIPVSKW